MSLERYTELAQKILSKNDPEQKYKGLSNLISQVADTLPNAIIDEHHDLVVSNRTLRFDGYLNEVYCYHSGMGFLESVSLLKQQRAAIEQWECDDEATIATREAMLSKYAQHEYIKYSNGKVHPDNIYCQHGSYRKYHDLKDTYYYRLGRMIQTNNADNGNLKVTMQMVCLYVALINERLFVEDELTLMGVEIPGDRRHMEWCDLSELREAASSYYSLLKSYSFTWNQDTNARVSRLHDAIANVKVDEIGDVLERFNVNQSLIINEVENIIPIVECLIDEIGMKMPEVKPFDPGVAEVFKFCNELRSVMTIELTKLRNRLKTDLTMGDEKAGQRLMSYLDGDYNDMDFRLFYNNYLIPDGDYFKDVDYSTIIHARHRRLNYLIGICTDDEVKDIMIELLRGVQHEIDVRNNAIPEPEQPTPSAENEQAAEATTKKVAPPSPSVDADRLKPFFNAKFKGAGGNPNRIDDLIKDIEKIKVTKELAMIAVMIYHCPSFIQKPSTFAAWLREFFDIIGCDCPKDTSKNKYKPSDTITRMFYYLQ